MSKTDLAQLKYAELRALVVLMSESRPLTNKELRELGGSELSGKQGKRLLSLGLVTVDKTRVPHRYALTDSGWRALREPYASESSDINVRLVVTLLARLQAGLDRTGLSLGDLFVPPGHGADERVSRTVAEVKELIRAAYAEQPKAPGGWVGLAALRAALSDINRADMDAALRELAGEKGVRLAPIDNAKALTRADREAALELGDSPRHMIAMGRP